MVKKNTLRTPPLEGILPGITRELIIKLAKKTGIRVDQSPLYVKDLADTDEAFLTNSILEVAPLVRVGSVRIGTGRPGGVTLLLKDSYRKASMKSITS
jgi:branched-subunit amino acid aminotransferase/4-amino-4-deoxychorismate lyase